MESTSRYQKRENEVGAGWEKQGAKGTYISINLTLDGQVHNIGLFKNTYKKVGSNQPDYVVLKLTGKPMATVGKNAPAVPAAPARPAAPVKPAAPVRPAAPPKPAVAAGVAASADDEGSPF